VRVCLECWWDAVASASVDSRRTVVLAVHAKEGDGQDQEDTTDDGSDDGTSVIGRVLVGVSAEFNLLALLFGLLAVEEREAFFNFLLETGHVLGAENSDIARGRCANEGHVGDSLDGSDRLFLECLELNLIGSHDFSLVEQVSLESLGVLVFDGLELRLVVTDKVGHNPFAGAGVSSRLKAEEGVLGGELVENLISLACSRLHSAELLF